MICNHLDRLTPKQLSRGKRAWENNPITIHTLQWEIYCGHLWSDMREGTWTIQSPYSHSGLKAAHGGWERGTAVKTLLPCKMMKTTWFKGAISEVRRWQRQAGLKPDSSLPIKILPPPCETRNAIPVWSTLPFYGNRLPAPLILEPILCSELAPLLMLQRLPTICKTSVHCCFRMGLMTPQLQHNLNTGEVSRNAIWKYIIVKKKNSILGIKISGFLFICMFVNIAFWNCIKNKSVFPFYL